MEEEAVALLDTAKVAVRWRRLRRRAGRGNGDACGGEPVGADRRSLGFRVEAIQTLARLGGGRTCELTSLSDVDLAMLVRLVADGLDGHL